MNGYLRHQLSRSLLVLLLPCAWLHTAAAADLADHPGYLDLENFALTGGELPTVEITLSGPVLKMLMQLPVEYDERDEVRELLRVVDQILVRVYEIDAAETADALDLIADASQKLETDAWTRIVRVRDRGRKKDDDNQNVDIHVKLSEDGENLSGLVIMAVEQNDEGVMEAVFVNIVGNFNPAYLANIGDQFDIDQLDGVEVP